MTRFLEDFEKLLEVAVRAQHTLLSMFRSSSAAFVSLLFHALKFAHKPSSFSLTHSENEGPLAAAEYSLCSQS